MADGEGTAGPEDEHITAGSALRRATGHDRDEWFALLDDWLEARGLQRRGPVGHAEARLARSRDVVEVALAHLRENETVFLHPPGACGECDEARAGMAP
jgi:aminoglycoside N3'-acetyltransferase